MSANDKKAMDRRKRRDARKIDRKKVLELRGQGLAVTDIATHQGVAPSTIWRYLERSQPQQEALERFKTGRADVLADIQAKSLHVQARILESLDHDGILAALTPYQKGGLLLSTNTVFGTTYDKERLERGKTTANVGLVARLMGEAVKTVHAPARATIDSEGAPEAERGTEHDSSAC